MFSFLKDVMRTDASLQAVAVDEKTKLARVMCELFVEAAHVDEGMDPEEGHVIAHIMAEHFDLSEDEMHRMFDEAMDATSKSLHDDGNADLRTQMKTR